MTAADLPEMAAIEGIHTAVAASATGYEGRPDMLLMRFDPGTIAAGVFTRSSCPAAPVRWSKARIAAGDAPLGLVFNAGNANCYTGPAGHELVRKSAERAAGQFGCAPENILVLSTGRIGVPLAEDVIFASIDDMAGRLAPGGFQQAAHAMMTTDTRPKAATRTLELGGTTVTLHGLAKGTLMIAPNMATTINLLLTDAAVDREDLQEMLGDAAARSYNLISVDETTSTNDSMLAFATGTAGNPPLSEGDKRSLRRALRDLTMDMTELMLADAKADGKILRVDVSGASGNASARRIARSVTRSLLVRRMVAREALGDPGKSSVGQVLAAVGGSTEMIDPDRVEIRIGGAVVLSQGAVIQDIPKAATDNVASDDVAIAIDCAIGAGTGTMRTVLEKGE
ncbi:MAG: bifunctional ornithine acetyltransferase/N-acetylglutamate synthase [Thalassobaculaceae bacterium]|nr:bifunctional ornithine acetyltransferase/N-acetylglutamate synthase [Thalassobaculaceae bacterium]